jgi:hypothetical protein
MHQSDLFILAICTLQNGKVCGVHESLFWPLIGNNISVRIQLFMWILHGQGEHSHVHSAPWKSVMQDECAALGRLP